MIDDEDLEDARARDRYDREVRQAKLAAEIEAGAAEVERLRAVRLATPPDPDWTRFGGSAAGMTNEEFNTWCIRGKPALSPPPPPKPAPAPVCPDLVTRAALQKKIEACAEATGEIIAVERKDMRDHVEAAIAKAHEGVRSRETALRERVNAVERALLEVREELVAVRREKLFDAARQQAEAVPLSNGRARHDA